MIKRKLYPLLVAVICIVPTFRAAQLTSTSSYTPPPNDARQYVVIGCVQSGVAGSGNASFMIKDFRGPIYRVDGNPDMLEFHVGHQVEIRGRLVEPETETVPPKIRYDSVVYLSRTCWK